MSAALSSSRTNSPTPDPNVRLAVKDLLMRSEAFAKLPPPTQQQIAHDTTQIANYLAVPEGIPGNKLPTAAAMEDPSRSTYKRDVEQVNKVGGKFQAAGAREGVEVAGMLMDKVDFPTFCSSLIQGVFHAIVQATIEQMEAYGKLVSSVAKSLNTFRDENVTANQGRDNLVDQFPDLFEIGISDGGGFGGFGDGGGGGPRVQLREGVDEDKALNRVNSSLPMEGGPLKSLDLSDDEVENKLVQASRTQLATSRQQLLATMVLMGINRIVVTDGKLQAKILYDFQARDNMRRQRSAAAFDFARDKYGNVQKIEGVERTSETGGERTVTRDAEGNRSDHRGGDYYSKGTYKYTQQPIMTAMSAAAEVSEAALQTRASLAGVMDINFTTDYLKLDKMADSFQIAMIQNAAKPGRGAAPVAGTQTAETQPAPATTAPAQK